MANKKLLLCCLLLNACLMGPDFKPPKPDVPESFLRQNQDGPSKVTEAELDVKWWQRLNDDKLNKLVERVAKENLDVQTATMRIKESRAQLGVTASDLFPQVNANASYQRIKESDKGAISLIGGGGGGAGGAGGAGGGGGGAGGGGGGGAGSQVPNTMKIPPFSIYQYGFDATWEIDLWGRVRRSVEAVGAQLQANEEERRAADLSAIAELVKDYVQLRTVQENVKTTKDNLNIADEFSRLTKERVKGGLATELDVANANAQAKIISAQLPQLEQQQSELTNAIALLLAEPPGALEKELAEADPIPPLPGEVPIGLSSELAKRRPDIREAEAKLHAATAEIGVAKADFFPRITLMGNGEMQALHFGDLDDWAAHSYTFGPNIELPIFEGGKLVSTLKLRKDEEKEAALAYRKTVLNAFHEVDNALTAFRKEQERSAELKAAIGQYQEALRLANERYKQGLSTYLDVLTAEQNLNSNQQQAINSQGAATINMVQLYKALGGGWENDFPAK